MKNVECAGNIDTSKNAYYIALGLKSIAIAMPHAFLTLVFLQKGMDYSEIAIIQALYSLGVILFEYPSGVLADKYQKKYIYLLSTMLLVISYLFVLFADSHFLIAVAWFIYGISTAMETGTIDAELMVSIKKNTIVEKVADEIGRFIGMSGRIASISAICGACIGYLLYKFIDISIYWIMMALVLTSGIITLLFFKVSNVVEKSNERKIVRIVKDSFVEIKKTAKLKYLIVLYIAFQVFLQVHYQLWQSFFIDCEISKNWFVGIYLAFQVITIIAYKLPVIKIFAKSSIPVGVVFTVSIILLYSINLPYFQLVIYMIPVFIISLASYYTEIQYNKIVQISNISSLTSLFSTIMRIFGFITLIFASKFMSIFSIRLLFLVIPICVILVVCFVIDNHFIEKSNGGSKT